MLTPVGMIPDISLAVWPCILVVDAFAILMAIVTGTFFAIVGTILLTLGITGVWIDRIPTVTPDVTTILLIIGAEAAFFFGVGIYAVEKILSKKVSEAGVDSHNGFREISPEMVREIPASGALWPFLLLVMVVLKLHLHTPSAVFGLAAVLSAMVLGLSVKLRTQWMPLICMARVAIFHSAVLTFVLAMNNFAVPAILQVKVYPAEIWVNFNTMFDYNAALKMCWPMVLAPLLLVLVLRRSDVVWNWRADAAPARIFRSQTGKAWFWSSAVVLVLAIFFSFWIPLFHLMTSRLTWSELWPAFAAGQTALLNSGLLSVVVATLVVAVAVLTWMASGCADHRFWD